jgi:starch-binding outer membrane protein, SusD/RagB family
MAALLFTSCSDILELNPQDKLSENDLWQDQKLIELYVNSSYHAVEHGLQFSFWSSMTDESHLIHDAGTWLVQKGDLTSDNIATPYDIGPEFNLWTKAYQNIRNINIFFSRIEEAPIDDEMKKRLTGEMKFIRAFVYSQMIWRYGGVPIVDKVFELGEDYGISRATYDECVTYILKDIDEAIALLPARQSASELGRASGHAAMALKARVLLYTASPLNNSSNDKAKWQKAADAAQALLNTGYSLNDDYQKLFLQDNNEIIFARYFSQNDPATEINLYNGRNGSDGWGGNCPTQNLVNDYEMTNGELPYTEVGGGLVVNPNSGYDPGNPYVNRDPRFYYSVLYDGSEWMGRVTETFTGGQDSPESAIQPWNASLTGYYLKKFMSPDIPPVGSAEKPKSPWIFFRLAEIYLNYAEAKFELGDEQTAKEYLNLVRSRNGVAMPPVTTGGEELRKKIQHERRIEMAFEGQRFFDVRRWKIASETEEKDLLGIEITKAADGSKSYKIITVLDRKFQPQHYLLPIPRVEIERSKNTLVQNPEY